MHRSPTLTRSASLVSIVAALAMILLLAAPAAADTSLTIELTGAQEVCEPANTCNDPEGTGTATVDITTATGEICVTLEWDISDGTASAAHIHEAPLGSAGGVVLPLFTTPEADGAFDDCFTDATLAAAIEAAPGDYYINIHSATYPNGAIRGQLVAGAPATTVMVMKHNCADVMTEAQFLAVEARAATNPLTPDAAFGMTVETVLECPTVVLAGEAQTAGAVAGGTSNFAFDVTGDDDVTVGIGDSTYEMDAACETEVMYDANRNNVLDASVCLDLSHHAFDVAAGSVTITETTAPTGFVFGALRFTPGSGDEETLVSAAGGVITLDTSNDEDGMVMLHVYNFAVAAASVAPSVSAAPSISDTTVYAAPTTGASTPALALAFAGVLALGGLGYLAMARRRR